MFIKTKIVVETGHVPRSGILQEKKIPLENCTINTKYISYYHQTDNPNYSNIVWQDGHSMFYEISVGFLNGMLINIDV